MKTSASITNLSVALLKAQKNIGSATKGSDNPYFRSKYADLGSVMEACKAALNNEGITVLQPVSFDTTGDYVETILLHTSGEFVSSTMKLVLAKNDMQAYGSAVSYARRYSLQSLVFIPAEDDDGEKTVVRERPKSFSETKPTVAVTFSAAPQAVAVAAVAPPVAAVAPPVAAVAPPVSAVAEIPKSRTTFRKSTAKAPVVANGAAGAATPVAATKSTAGGLNFS